jgi:hypothetical protein
MNFHQWKANIYKLTNIADKPVYIFEPITAIVEYEEITVVHTATTEFEVKERFNEIFNYNTTQIFN